MSINFSFEVFPASTEKGFDKLVKTIGELELLSPDFISVTYGAGGTTKNRTKKVAKKLLEKFHTPIAAHLTTVNEKKKNINRVIDDFWNLGIRHIVALRGDCDNLKNHLNSNDRYHYAIDLIKQLKKMHGFDISVSAYAEGHPEAPSCDFDMKYLKQKLDAGANRALTQFFFDPEIFLRFRDKVYKKGIDTNIVIPGIIPILDFPKLHDFATGCGASVPTFLYKMFKNFDKKSVDHKLLAMNVLSHQITRLVTEGVTSFHFYTLNETILTKHICNWLKTGF